jgi:mannose-6-phosphate isomerase-like protein (cupin superfamily)
MQRRATCSDPSKVRAVGVVGDVYRLLATGVDTDGKYSTLEALIPPGGGPPLHVHSREEESFFILEGEVTFQLGEETLVATTGMFANVPIGLKHCFQNKSNRQARMLITVAPAGLEEMFIEVGTALSEGTSQGIPPTPDDIQRLLNAAPRYGITIFPPEQH